MGDNRNQTAEEYKQELIDTMGNELGFLFYELLNDVYYLSSLWEEFKELYGVNEKRINLLNQTAPYLFYLVHTIFWKELILTVTRITDPEKTGPFVNASLYLFISKMKDEPFKEECKKELEFVNASSEFCRDWRNKWIAHKDYNITTNPEAKQLSNGSRNDFQKIVEMIQQLTNKIQAHYLDSTTYYIDCKSIHGAESLIEILEYWVQNKEQIIKDRIAKVWGE
ncbi:MAG: hypothetical protein A2X64_05175 [Ignavibacteria bacterium GWF2_33_9]|nr:MAG: hypothetical protein A2X64_05175 [Ignavibacteria bacterium GWF2_33_9]